jgi:ATP-binding cassette subfamily F protein uup
LSYLQDFLFAPNRARTPVKALSGGEKNRLLLARILLKPNNLLILDEPTNDLDIETLELLEEMLANYQGTLLLVSHDREFVDNTVTTSWIFEGNGVIEEFVGGYHDAKQQREQVLASRAVMEKAAKIEKVVEETPKTTQPKNNSKKLSYKLQRELEALPAKLEQLESDIETLQEQVNDPEFFTKPVEQTQPVWEQRAAVEQELEIACEGWEDLDAMHQDS